MANKIDNTTRLSQEQIERRLDQGEDQTDWQQADSASDIGDEGEFDWSQATIGIPPAKQQLSIRFDIDVVDWFRSQGKGYQTRMNQVLRHYVEAQREKQREA